MKPTAYQFLRRILRNGGKPEACAWFASRYGIRVRTRPCTIAKSD